MLKYKLSIDGILIGNYDSITLVIKVLRELDKDGRLAFISTIEIAALMAEAVDA